MGVERAHQQQGFAAQARFAGWLFELGMGLKCAQLAAGSRSTQAQACRGGALIWGARGRVRNQVFARGSKHGGAGGRVTHVG